ncbi:MAG: ECF transporter S component, partial [Oscillospiraceae bacterium]|nr:ECF transporter S component [Oscillospiraceae bacterium]
KLDLSGGRFSGKDILRFNVTQIIAHIICWGGIAPALDVLIYHEPTEKLVAQGLMAGIANIVTTAVIGTLLCLAYAKSRPQKGSLEEEKDA